MQLVKDPLASNCVIFSKRSACFYICYMDDILVLATSRWRLRRAIKSVRQGLGHLGLELHPDKTSIGRIARVFDFVGYQFDPTGLRLSAVTLRRYQEKLTRLYEQYQRRLRAFRRQGIGQTTIPRLVREPGRAYSNSRPNITSHEDTMHRFEVYKRRFDAWTQGGLKICEIGYLG